MWRDSIVATVTFSNDTRFLFVTTSKEAALPTLVDEAFAAVFALKIACETKLGSVLFERDYLLVCSSLSDSEAHLDFEQLVLKGHDILSNSFAF